MTNEAFARIKIDQLLNDTDWRLTDGISVRSEYPLDDGGRADYALFDRQGRALAVLEAKRTGVSLSAGEAQDMVAACLTTEGARALRPALDHATQVIEGFQSPFGLELLATVDWLNRREGGGRWRRVR